jgi:hypothetical protein
MAGPRRNRVRRIAGLVVGMMTVALITAPVAWANDDTMTDWGCW